MVFPRIVVPQNGWFIMDIPIKMDDFGVPLFSETPTMVESTDLTKSLLWTPILVESLLSTALHAVASIWKCKFISL